MTSGRGLAVVTEAQAAVRGCPVSAAKVRYEKGSMPMCIGSRCMAWRWGSRVEVYDPRTGRSETHEGGYCGLAGAP